VTAKETLELLQDFHRDKLAMLLRHGSTAQAVSDYDFNNTYQYVIAREEMHVRWLSDAIGDLGGQTPDIQPPPDPGKVAQSAAITKDRDDAHAFVEKWRPRIETMTHARHRTMLNVVIGETLEHKRFFEQALAGRSDLLGRRADGAGTGGGVLPTRWIEQ
jgi:Mn-containing catalase